MGSEPATVLLDQGWSLCLSAAGACASTSDAVRLAGWIPASAPGTAAQALRAAGRWSQAAPTPLHDQDIWYRTTLTLEGAYRLRFGGLATLAEVWLGERPILTSTSMFEPAEAEVEVTPGDALWICFRALAPRLAGKGPRARWRPRMIESQGLRLVRATLLGHMPGWCWPVDVVGPWRAITAQPIRPREILDAHLRPQWIGRGGRLSVDMVATGLDQPRLHCAGASGTFEAMGQGRWRAELDLPDVRPWWPHTHGDQPLYEVEVTDGEARFLLGRTGFRSLKVDRGADGRSFSLTVNSEPVFCRGAAWIAPDLMSLGGDRAAYEPTLRQARAAGMNMVRISGVGVYETRAFFDVCDELGLLVWQDFMFANFDYPAADPQFVEAVRREARAQLSEIGPAPSLAVLCGGSEVMQQATMMGLAPASLSWPLFDEVLPGVAAELRADAPYLPNSPWGGALPFVAGEGVTHYYGVGAYERPLEDARRAEVRFAAECLAFANVPAAESLEGRLTAPAVHDPRWKAAAPRDRGASWDFEDVRDHYLGRLFGQDPHRLRRENPDLYLDLSRAVSGEAMAAVFAEWRRARSPCAGGLVWTLRDQQLGAGWGLIDALGAPKPALRILARSLQPVQVLITDEGTSGLSLHLINERPEPVRGEIRLFACTTDAVVLDVRQEVELPARGSQELSAFELIGRFFDISYAYRFGPRSHDAVCAQLIVGGEVASETIHVLPHVDGWANGGAVSAEVEEDGEGPFLRLVAERLQRFVQIQDSAFTPADDWFWLAPGEAKRVRLLRREGAAGEARPRGELRAPGGAVLAAYGD